MQGNYGASKIVTSVLSFKKIIPALAAFCLQSQSNLSLRKYCSLNLYKINHYNGDFI